MVDLDSKEPVRKLASRWREVEGGRLGGVEVKVGVVMVVETVGSGGRRST